MVAVDEVPGFVRTVYTLLRVCDDSIIGWSEDGTQILIKEPDRFAAEVCPKFFRHRNFNSFTRCRLSVFIELELDADGVDATSRHRDAVDAAVRESRARTGAVSRRGRSTQAAEHVPVPQSAQCPARLEGRVFRAPPLSKG